jgi:hypothetical protein
MPACSAPIAKSTSLHYLNAIYVMRRVAGVALELLRGKAEDKFLTEIPKIQPEREQATTGRTLAK